MEQVISEMLNEVSVIIDNHKAEKKTKREAGEDFNIFRILKMESNETKTHSAFIAELLNPKGSHGQGLLFLKLFIKHVNCLEFSVEDDTSFKVETERYIGNKTHEHEAEDPSGRIDLVIESISEKRTTAILIENKIYARDQKNQLVRYYAYGIKGTPERGGRYGKENFWLLYLTLKGEEASKFSTLGSEYKLKCSQDINSDENYYYLISYKEHILPWLEECRKKSTIFPILREGISHYINLLNRLISDYTMNTKMTETILKNAKTAEAFFEISKDHNVNGIKIKIQSKFWNALENELCDKFKISTVSDFHERVDYQKIKNYYTKPKGKFYGIEFKIASITTPKIDVHFRVAMNNEHVIYGLKFRNNGERVEHDIVTLSPYKEILKKEWTNSSKDWPIFEYLTIPKNNKKIDFKNFDSNLLGCIVDENNRKEFIEKFVKKVKEDLDKFTNEDAVSVSL
ncbi:MAG: PD-(D/E)XK nuclease family protein [Paludibacter sp.]